MISNMYTILYTKYITFNTIAICRLESRHGESAAVKLVFLGHMHPFPSHSVSLIGPLDVRRATRLRNILMLR